MKNFKMMFLLILTVLSLAACGGSDSGSDDKENSEGVKSTETTVETVAETTMEATEKEEAKFPFDIDVYDEYRNDVTGKWRRAAYAGAEYIMQDYAVDYYKAFFNSDDEIHFIWNASLKTVTKISKLGGDLDVCTFDYVDGEEHDAALAASGTLLKEVFVNIETGDVEEIQ